MIKLFQFSWVPCCCNYALLCFVLKRPFNDPVGIVIFNGQLVANRWRYTPYKILLSSIGDLTSASQNCWWYWTCKSRYLPTMYHMSLSHFKGKAQRDEVTCLRSHRKSWNKLTSSWNLKLQVLRFPVFIYDILHFA